MKKMESVLNVEVSFFERCDQTGDPKTVNLLAYLRDESHRQAVEQVRRTAGKAERDGLKKRILPGITPSGVFSVRRESGLLKHSGLIAGDIDLKENPFSPESLKRQLCKIREVAFCQLSASGMGLWFLVPVAFPGKHKAHFAALVNDFADLGIRLDKAPANVASFRFCSFDPDPFFNHAAEPYTKTASGEEKRRPPDLEKPPGNDADKVEAVLCQIEARRLDLTTAYADWFAIGCALAAGFGEDGRGYFHRVSQFHPGYEPTKADRQFSACLQMRENRFSLGTLFDAAKRHGLFFDERQRTA